MKALTLFFCILFSLPAITFAQTANEMLVKVTSAVESGQQGQAVSYFREAVSRDIDRSEMYYWTDVDKNSEVCPKLAAELVTVYKKSRNYDKAYLFYKELLQKNPNNIDYLLGCAEMEVSRGKEKEALNIYQQVLRLDADNLAANIYIGNYFYLKAESDKRQLESEYKKITTPNRMQYARYRDRLQNLFADGYGKAREYLQNVVRMFPSTEAKKTLDKILIIEKEMNR